MNSEPHREGFIYFSENEEKLMILFSLTYIKYDEFKKKRDRIPLTVELFNQYEYSFLHIDTQKPAEKPLCRGYTMVFEQVPVDRYEKRHG